MDLWLLSDIHLKSKDERNSKILLRFLLSLKNGEKPATHLILLGDIFDLWIGGHEVFIKRWQPHLAVIKDLIETKRVEIIFIEGNHDVHIAPYWEKKLGARVFTEPVLLDIKPYLIHLEHGDLINQKDKTYLKYRAVIRSAPLKFLGLNLPGVFWDKLGVYLSKKSGEHSRQLRAEQMDQMRLLIREHALKLVNDENANSNFKQPDYIFTGHFHLKDEFEILKHGKRTQSVNLGSWLGESVQAYYLNESGGSFVDLI